MALHKDYDGNSQVNDFNFEEEDVEEMQHKKRVRRLLEDRLERKRLKEELEEEWEDNFDWDATD